MLEQDKILIEIDEEERRQAASIPAKRLREKLLPLKSKVEQTAKRWFWELLQNASDYNETVDVRLEVNDEQVVFRHNGNPFSIRDALNLISPDSGKDSDELKKDNIGKFGSGLVSTHILSSEISVEGAFKSSEDDKLYKFNIFLDRSSYENKEKLIESIEESKQSFRDNQTPIINGDYSGFMTSFSYNLLKRLPDLINNNDAVSLGLDQIYEVLPYTLCFMTKVQSVEIFDKRAKAEVSEYKIERKHNSDSLIKFDIQRNGIRIQEEFVKLKYEQVETIYKQVDSVVQPLPKDISRLFCGLPMIGSENIGLPFILNSFDFEPTIEREGVELTPNDTVNRSLFKQSTILYKLLLKDLSEKKLENAYCLTELSNKYNGVEGSRNIFKRDYVSEYKQAIESSRIVKNIEGDFISFAEALIPYKDGKAFCELYQFASEIKSKRFPSQSSYPGWAEAINFNIFDKQKYNLNMFVDELSRKEQVHTFVLANRTDPIVWLRDIASLVNEEDESLFYKYAILPNQRGYLKKNNELFIDKDIPYELKAILNKLDVEPIEQILLDKAFNDFTNVIINTQDIADICRKIDNLLKEKYSAENGSTASFTVPLNDLYKWINTLQKSKKELEELFSWFYPKRATLFMDSFGDMEMDYAFTIVQSGKIKALSALAESNISPEELEYLSKNPEAISKLYALLQDEIDDMRNADARTGEYGEELVLNDLRRKYKSSNGYEVIWASKNGKAEYDFEVKYRNETVLFVDAKTTMRGIANSDSIPFFMRNSQWNFLPTIGTDVKYLIARVFKADNSIKYLEINSFNN